MERYEPGEGVNSRQALVAGGNTAASGLLQIGKERTHVLGAQIGHRKLLDGLVQLGTGKRNQEREGVPIAVLRIARQIPFADKMFQEEAANPWTE
jgi:hypothetical protein